MRREGGGSAPSMPRTGAWRAAKAPPGRLCPIGCRAAAAAPRTTSSRPDHWPAVSDRMPCSGLGSACGRDSRSLALPTWLQTVPGNPALPGASAAACVHAARSAGPIPPSSLEAARSSQAGWTSRPWGRVFRPLLDAARAVPGTPPCRLARPAACNPCARPPIIPAPAGAGPIAAVRIRAHAADIGSPSAARRGGPDRRRSHPLNHLKRKPLRPAAW